MKNLSVPSGKIDVVLDTDAYNEIDDQFAISYMIKSKEKIHVKDSALGANTLLPILKKEIKTGKKIAILIKGSNAIKMNIISDALIHFCI